MMVPEPANILGKAIASSIVSICYEALGSHHGLDASFLYYACNRDPDGAGAGALHLCDEPDVRCAGVAGAGDRETERSDSPDDVEVRRLRARVSSFETKAVPSCFFLLTCAIWCD